MKDTFFVLLRSAIDGSALVFCDRATLAGVDLSELYARANQHDLAHLVGHALFRRGLVEPDSPWYHPLQKIQLKAVYRYEQSRHDLMKISEALEAAHIAHMPLKGAVVRDYYPEAWLRTSCDIDVLVHEEDLDRAVQVLCEQGWSVQSKKGFHDISLYSAGGAHLELHFNLKENRASIDRLLEQVWDYAEPVQTGTYCYRQNNEFLMFHLLAHMSYHFISGGCGVRSFLDIWILRKALRYDEAKLRQMCEGTQILTFYESALKLIDVWFEGGEHTELTRQMENYVLEGGTYGSVENRVAVNQVQAGGRLRNLRRRVFLPFAQLKLIYPVLKRHAWLCPVFEVVRWFDILVTGRMKRAMKELSINQKSSAELIQNTEVFLDRLGLKKE